MRYFEKIDWFGRLNNAKFFCAKAEHQFTDKMQTDFDEAYKWIIKAQENLEYVREKILSRISVAANDTQQIE